MSAGPEAAVSSASWQHRRRSPDRPARPASSDRFRPWFASGLLSAQAHRVTSSQGPLVVVAWRGAPLAGFLYAGSSAVLGGFLCVQLDAQGQREAFVRLGYGWAVKLGAAAFVGCWMVLCITDKVRCGVVQDGIRHPFPLLPAAKYHDWRWWPVRQARPLSTFAVTYASWGWRQGIVKEYIQDQKTWPRN